MIALTKRTESSEMKVDICLLYAVYITFRQTGGERSVGKNEEKQIYS